MGSFVGRLVAVLAIAAVSSAPAGAATYAKGIDVSHFNGAINWIQVATASYRFVYAKATEGSTLIDPTYSINRTGGKSLGLRVGGYHFARPAGSSDPARIANAVTQADFFLTVAQPQPGELPPALDLETKNGLSQAALQTWTSAWLGEIAARTGVSAAVYASPNFWKTALGNTESVAGDGHRLWIAHWTTNAAPLVPGANWNGLGWTFWQWTDCATVPGLAHCTDGDRYNGTDPGAVTIASYPGGAPAAASPPTVVGTAQTAKTLAGLPGSWAGGKPVTFLYQWQRCDAAGANCTPIVGATSETYVPVTDDVGHALVLAVTAQAFAGSAVASSPATVAVVAGGSSVARPAATSTPTVTGTAQAGQTFTTSVGTWTGAPTSFAYQWRRCDVAGAQCTAILGANAASYTLSPGDIGSTISLVVTATGKGGSTSASTATTSVVVAAPVPAAVPGSAVAQPTLAGAVVSPDGRATVTWQPGAVPIGSTVSLSTSGQSLVLAVSPTLPQLPWPVDVAFADAADSSSIVGYSSDGKVWRPAVVLKAAALPAGQVAGAYVDAGGLLHTLLRAPEQLRLFVPGSWGDPTRVSGGLPTPRLASGLHVTRLRDGSVRVTGLALVPSQARVLVNVIARTRIKHTQLLKPGAVGINIRLQLPHGRTARLKIAATDPYGRHGTLVLTFRGP